MSQFSNPRLLDHIFNEVSLDERIKDGIFQMEEESHMDALRDSFIKNGITKEESVKITNRMTEGKYPNRQAWRKEDGILVTWPSPQYKKNALDKNPGKYTDKDPNPSKTGEKLEPTKEPETKENVPKSPDPKSVFQGGTELSIEPDRGDKKPEPIADPPTSPVIRPTSPERKSAEKEVVRQIMSGDDTKMASKWYPPIMELYNLAKERGLKETMQFLESVQSGSFSENTKYDQ